MGRRWRLTLDFSPLSFAPAAAHQRGGADGLCLRRQEPAVRPVAAAAGRRHWRAQQSPPPGPGRAPSALPLMLKISSAGKSN